MSARTYNGYVNNEIKKHTGLLFGPQSDLQDETSDAEDNPRNVRQRRAEGEVPVPPSFDGESDEGGEADVSVNPWYPAEDLSYFKKGIDPEFFEWVNPDEIQPGGVTCGFLKPYLGTTPGLTFPKVEVYVCMHFATEQPAKKGTVFVHCGGPSSLSDCSMITFLGEGSQDDYNFLTIDQRGLGRSYPSFAHEACNIYKSSERSEDGTIDEDSFHIDPFSENGTDYYDEDSVKLRLEPYKERVLSCWQCEDCGFFFNTTQEDGSTKPFHFLEYSGTRQLAEDIERIRILLNAPVMNVYGISYGTSVFGTYATLFPSKVGLMVLDGNVNPLPDLEYIAWTLGRGQDTRINYALFSCSADVIFGGTCVVPDLAKCVSDINGLLNDSGIGAGSAAKNSIAEIITAMITDSDRAQEICDLAEASDVAGLVAVLDEILSEGPTVETRQAGSPSQPTSEQNVYGNPDYEFMMFGGVEAQMVEAQDGFSALYNADYFAKKVVEFADLFVGAGTGLPVARFFEEWVKGFYWPKGVPLAPIGNPYLTGIIAGQLYDPNTPYVWTQNMRNSFKSTSLLTSQATEHGLIAIDDGCLRHIQDYFRNGYVDIVDGTVCGSDFASSSIIFEAFGLT